MTATATPGVDPSSSFHLPQPLPSWLDAVQTVAAHYRLDVSRERLRVALSWGDTRKMQDNGSEAARQAGLRMSWVKPRIKGLTTWRMPEEIQLRHGHVGVVTDINRSIG